MNHVHIERVDGKTVRVVVERPLIEGTINVFVGNGEGGFDKIGVAEELTVKYQVYPRHSVQLKNNWGDWISS